MPTQPINVIQEELSPEQLSEELAKLQKTLRYLLNGQLDFENIRVKGIKAETIDVDELSAISANLGHITAGLIEAVSIIGSVITGSLIQTKEPGNYPRAYMSTDGASFVVETAPGRAVFIHPAGGGVPAVVFQDAGKQTVLDFIGGGVVQRILTGGTILQLSSAGGITLNGTDVLAALAGKANTFSGYTGFITVGNGSGGTMQLHFNNGVLVLVT